MTPREALDAYLDAQADLAAATTAARAAERGSPEDRATAGERYREARRAYRAATVALDHAYAAPVEGRC